jgi:membrane protein implicated in regulation of membrane protease activity
MELWLVWIVAGFALLIAELLTGTFYLLVVAIGAFTGAAVAWMGGNVLLQAVAGSVLAIAGAVLVHHWHARQPKDARGSNFLDRGQPVILEGWANEAANIARVKYRGAWWDAKLKAPGPHPAPGTTLYIEGHEGNMLILETAPPAP